jgi:hypothetical protein
MVPLALGILALIVVIALLQGFSGANPKTLAKSLRWFGAGALLVAAIGLAAIDRVGLAALVASMAWGLFTSGHVWPSGWPNPFGYRGGASSPSDQSTRVTTEWLEMVLDHATGSMTGTVVKGDFAGRALDDLSQSEFAAQLRAVAGADGESERLLEAYAERRFGKDWRSSPGFAPPPASGMTHNEALAVLGLSSGATEDEIRAAHRRLILQNHPDRGGSSYLAAKINEAKDVLLGRS